MYFCMISRPFYSAAVLGVIAAWLVFAQPAPAQEHHAVPAAEPSASQPEQHPGQAAAEHHEQAGAHEAPSLIWIAPFVALLLCIALLPLIPSTAHWWHHNRSKLIVAMLLALVTLLYYLLRGTGFGHGEHAAPPGMATVVSVLHHAVLSDYIPFIVLLFSLYTISGGIQLRGDLRANPITNCAFIGTGAVLASLIGTTGAAMLLIRPLLQTNAQRRHVRHTVIFFIFLVANIGGSLLPIGDPPLFLGYLRGVPFTWTLGLWREWLFACSFLLVVYWVWDTVQYRREPAADLLLDRLRVEPLRLSGKLNLLWLLGVVLAVALLVPGRQFPGTNWTVPDHTPGLRELAQLVFAGLAWLTTSPQIRKDNDFNFGAIAEVAALFIGIFITMQVPVEILNIKGPSLGLSKPWQFFWAAGMLSSFLDNAPTYVVYFQTAGTLAPQGMALLPNVQTALGTVPIPLLTAVSLGSVFMGANTYIGNGPNFMVKSIAEQAGVKMPSFFGYMLYSVLILIPTFLGVMFIFLL